MCHNPVSYALDMFVKMILALVSVSFVVGAALGSNIPECYIFGKMTIIEGNEAVISCVDFGQNVTVQWSVIDKNGNNRSLGTCGKFTTSLNNSDFRIEQNLANTCTLRILRNHRAMAGTIIRCSEENGGAFVDCNVTVEYPANINGCSLQTNTEEWKVFGICNITKVFSSNNDYYCRWFRQRKEMDYPKPLAGRLNLSDFYDSTGQVYKNGTCSMETYLGEAGNETYSISVRSTSSSKFVVRTININSPEEPVTNCPVYVTEGKNLSCDCLPNSSRPGNPPPVLKWSRMSSSHLQIDRVQLQDEGQNFTCRLTWGRNQTFHNQTQYTVQIEYPPKSYPIITGHNTSQILSVGSTVVISCSATGGKPPISSVKLFCGKYQSHSDLQESQNLTQITVTCNVTMNVTSTDNGTICTCRAIWDPDPDLPTLKTSITLLVANEIDGSSKEGTQSAAIIGGVVGATLFVIIVIATVIIFIKICNKSSDKRTDEIANDDVDNGNYDDLRLTEVGLRSSYASFHVCNNDQSGQSINDEF